MGTLRLRPAIFLRTDDARPGTAPPVRMTMDMDGRGASGYGRYICGRTVAVSVWHCTCRTTPTTTIQSRSN